MQAPFQLAAMHSKRMPSLLPSLFLSLSLIAISHLAHTHTYIHIRIRMCD